jgi:hypothetical protein
MVPKNLIKSISYLVRFILMAGTRHTSVAVYMIIVFGLISSECNNLYAIFTVFISGQEKPLESPGIWETGER